MCGRYAATMDPTTLIEQFGAADTTGGHFPPVDYNVAPTKDVVTVVQRHPRDADGTVLPDEPAERTLRVMRWGLVPFWAKDPAVGNKMINARAETAAGKPAFRKALTSRRCLVPADGWYEWRRAGKEKEAFFMTGPGPDAAPLAMAGLWETWRDPKSEPGASPLITFTVLTTESVGNLVEIHHRMPLLLPRDKWENWLDPDSEDVTSLLTPPSLDLVDALELRPVSSKVNNVRNNGPELLDRVDAAVRLDDEDALFELPRS